MIHGDKSILICGAGAIGSNLTANLVADLKGQCKITVLDKDTVEERNVTPGTQFYTPDQVGQPKVEALQFNVYKQFQREIEIINVNLSQTEMTWGQMESGQYDLIIDCFDNENARSLVQESWRQRNLYKKDFDVLHVGFSDQFTFAVEWADNYTVPTDITTGFDICEMPGARSFVASVAALGSLVAQKWVDDGEKMEIVGGKYTHSIIK